MPPGGFGLGKLIVPMFGVLKSDTEGNGPIDPIIVNGVGGIVWIGGVYDIAGKGITLGLGGGYVTGVS